MVLKQATVFSLVFLSLACQGKATQKMPWLGNPYEFEVRPSLIYQHYNVLSSDSHTIGYRSDDVFLNGSLSNSLPSFGVELEAAGAWTRHQRGCLDHIELTGRYLWLDDVAGDPISAAFGLSFIQAFRCSLHDVSSFHHGLSEAELFISIGKETSCGDEWASRWWGVLGLGAAANGGSPWVCFDMAFDKRFFQKHELRLLVHSLWGLGHQRLRLHDFEGYGSVQHQSVDLAVRYTYLLDFIGSASIEYAYRVHARNYPEYAHQVIAQVLCTFGL